MGRAVYERQPGFPGLDPPWVFDVVISLGRIALQDRRRVGAFQRSAFEAQGAGNRLVGVAIYQRDRPTSVRRAHGSDGVDDGDHAITVNEIAGFQV